MPIDRFPQTEKEIRQFVLEVTGHGTDDLKVSDFAELLKKHLPPEILEGKNLLMFESPQWFANDSLEYFLQRRLRVGIKHILGLTETQHALGDSSFAA